jgi:hypothetical protein
MVEQLRAWAAGLVTAAKVSDRINQLDRWENGAWKELDVLDKVNSDKSPSHPSDVERMLRVALLCQQNRMAIRFGGLVEAFGPQISAIPGILRASLEMSVKKPSEHALLKRFFECPTEGEATAAGIDLAASLCSKDNDHPLDPEIRALRAETDRVAAEMSKLMDASYYREELDRKRKRLSELQQERVNRPAAVKEENRLLVLIPHYREMRTRIARLEESVARCAEFAAMDKLLGELFNVSRLPEWRDGSPESLDGLVKLVVLHNEFAALSSKTSASR